MIKFSIVLLMVCSVLVVSIPALACLGPMAEIQTYFTVLPEKANEKNVVGKVKILSVTTMPESNDILSVVQVVEPVKGVTDKQIFIVISQGRHSCNRDPELIISSEHYIAGKFDAGHHFRGVWKGAGY